MAGLLRASEEGLKIIDMVRRNLGWNKTEDTWCKAALTSKATLKRFWTQNRIRRETFIDICKAVGINNWEDIIERNDIKQTELLLAAAIADIPLDNQTDRTFPLPENLPPVRNWVQRTKEIDTLKTLITPPPLTNESPTLAPPLTKGGLGGVPIAISIVGLPGTGKTTLASQLIRQLHTENTPFASAAWQSLQSATSKAPPFDRTIDSLLFTLSNGEITPAITPQNDYFKKTENLLKILREKPCLLAFDRAETLLQTKEAKTAGYFAADCAEYAWLFKQLLETEHQSKIIFTSRESLAELPPTITREIRLDGLTKNCAVALLTSFNLIARIEELTELALRYRGHPEALQLIASLIRDDSEYQGNVSNFLQDRDWLLTRSIETLLDEIIARLSDIEQTCTSRISVYQTAEYPLNFAAIAAQMPEVSKYELQENIIQALKRRQLLYYDTQRSSYQLHPLVQEKGEWLLNQNPENFRTAHRQAYRYFISIPLKPESEWQDIEDIKPLMRAHYHGCQAGDLDAAAIAISGVDEYLRVWNYPEQICSHPPLPLLANVQEFTEDFPQDSDV
ncbi:MAG: ATP-binding protein [Microcoleus sp. PH2017_10_PVI_O_A]|uniref:AAA family ATPase n=1 Tax=unclassified Microcoleus TaxID=2642155 RepID=UPI001E09786B|nr:MULTISPECIES: AAA family ATPase [unclassified Microcoleus]TAE80867.1 MAG: ATP-binding protein [Oscillatoriales cyanobacterium]MCC3407380.1 ATP-binding protein [Microcoleus sp. PH2017_10_PVI_O_A]MCC3461438.1 ATP-binding protein [Microcoleus sp. PH2017_11_PCY_U_A]MCC3479913.1 ATP-binding protein [Microcoleus sp. PH2017_12_PCY_D_A]MCC3560590.1 ATP-binding protein [Microcoleus sp. PH2017_27_LUM_O_A]